MNSWHEAFRSFGLTVWITSVSFYYTFFFFGSKSPLSNWTGLWETWVTWRCPCSLQGGWTRGSLKVPSTPNYFMILWFYVSMIPWINVSSVLTLIWISFYQHLQCCLSLILNYGIQFKVLLNFLKLFKNTNLKAFWEENKLSLTALLLSL